VKTIVPLLLSVLFLFFLALPSFAETICTSDQFNSYMNSLSGLSTSQKIFALDYLCKHTTGTTDVPNIVLLGCNGVTQSTATSLGVISGNTFSGYASQNGYSVGMCSATATILPCNGYPSYGAYPFRYWAIGINNTGGTKCINVQTVWEGDTPTCSGETYLLKPHGLCFQTASQQIISSTPTKMCGDGVCENGETITSCSQDCQIISPPTPNFCDTTTSQSCQYGCNRTAQQCNSQPPIICPQEVKVCPDGSYAPRIPPSCEFADCPSIINPPIGGTTNVIPLIILAVIILFLYFNRKKVRKYL